MYRAFGAGKALLFLVTISCASACKGSGLRAQPLGKDAEYLAHQWAEKKSCELSESNMITPFLYTAGLGFAGYKAIHFIFPKSYFAGYTLAGTIAFAIAIQSLGKANIKQNLGKALLEQYALKPQPKKISRVMKSIDFYNTKQDINDDLTFLRQKMKGMKTRKWNKETHAQVFSIAKKLCSDAATKKHRFFVCLGIIALALIGICSDKTPHGSSSKSRELASLSLIESIALPLALIFSRQA